MLRKVTIIAAVLCILGLSVFSGMLAKTLFKAAGKMVEKQSIPALTAQLPSINGIVPVEITKAEAIVTAPNTLDTVTCTIRNNSTKAIDAIYIFQKVNTVTKGKDTTDTTFYIIDTLLQKGVREIHNLKPIGQGEERVLESSGPTTYTDGSLIKSVELTIDYVEFDDHSSVGLNLKGERTISEIRSGAQKYKDWVARKYAESGKSVEVLIKLLEAHDLPADAGLDNSRLKQGARIFRQHVLDDYREHRSSTHLDQLFNF